MYEVRFCHQKCDCKPVSSGWRSSWKTETRARINIMSACRYSSGASSGASSCDGIYNFPMSGIRECFAESNARFLRK